LGTFWDGSAYFEDLATDLIVIRILSLSGCLPEEATDSSAEPELIKKACKHVGEGAIHGLRES